MSVAGLHVPDGAELETLLLYLVAALTFVSVLAVWRVLLQPDPSAARSRMLAERRRQLIKATQTSRPPRRVAADLRSLARFGRQLKVLQAAQAERARTQLLQAGYRGRDSLPILIAAKVGLAICASVAALLIVNVLHVVSPPKGLTPLAPLAGLVLGFFTPDLYMSNRTKKRRQALQRTLPDGLDLLVICAEAGLSLDAALARVAEEIAPSAPELADELALTAIELSFLPDRRSALLNLGKRCDIPAIRGVVNTLVQTERYGTPLSQSLRVLSSDFREQRMMQAEEKAARLPAILTVPMIVFILPALFIVLGGPAVIDVYDNLVR